MESISAVPNCKGCVVWRMNQKDEQELQQCDHFLSKKNSCQEVALGRKAGEIYLQHMEQAIDKITEIVLIITY